MSNCFNSRACQFYALGFKNESEIFMLLREESHQTKWNIHKIFVKILNHIFFSFQEKKMKKTFGID